MKNIIYINADYRDARYKYDGEKTEIMPETVKPVFQVYKSTHKKYKIGDYIHLSLEMKPYGIGKTFFKQKILWLKEEVLAKVIAIHKNVITVDIVKE